MLDSISTFDSSNGAIVEVSEMQGKVISEGTVILTYVSTMSGSSARRSSLWQVFPEGWRIVFHQGTKL